MVVTTLIFLVAACPRKEKAVAKKNNANNIVKNFFMTEVPPFFKLFVLLSKEIIPRREVSPVQLDFQRCQRLKTSPR
jgi:hypothetical protein